MNGSIAKIIDYYRNGADSELVASKLETAEAIAEKIDTESLIQQEKGFLNPIIGHRRKLRALASRQREDPVDYLRFLIQVLMKRIRFYPDLWKSDKGKKKSGGSEGRTIGQRDGSDLLIKQIHDLYLSCGRIKDVEIREQLRSISEDLERQDIKDVLNNNHYLDYEQKKGMYFYTNMEALTDSVLKMLCDISVYDRVYRKLDREGKIYKKYFRRERQRHKHGSKETSDKGNVPQEEPTNTKNLNRYAAVVAPTAEEIEQYFRSDKLEPPQDKRKDIGAVRNAMTFLRAYCRKVTDRTYLPIWIDTVTGCGIYVLGQDFSERRSKYHAIIAILNPRWHKADGYSMVSMDSYIPGKNDLVCRDVDIEKENAERVIAFFNAAREDTGRLIRKRNLYQSIRSDEASFNTQQIKEFPDGIQQYYME